MPPFQKPDRTGGVNKARYSVDLAALSVLVLFDFGLLKAALDTQMDLVSSHIRIVWFVPSHREYLISAYPCEPILANAAFYHLQELHQARKWPETLSILRDALAERIIDKGDKGETVARLILILAYRKAIGTPPTPLPTHLEPVPTVSVRDFLQALLPTTAFKKFWKHTPDDGGPSNDPPTLGSVFGNAKIYFTHFVRYEMEPTITHLWTAVVRGHAIQCMHGQKGVDIVIPIVLDSASKVASRGLSAILIQVKNRQTHVQATPLASDLGWFSEGQQDLHPYISILLDLELSVKEPTGDCIVC